MFGAEGCRIEHRWTPPHPPERSMSMLYQVLSRDPIDLIRLNVEIENRINAAGDLLPLPSKASALFSVHRHATVQRLLSTHVPCDRVFAGQAYAFAHVPAPAEYPDAALHEGAYVIRADGAPMSWAWTQEESEDAAELPVETLPGYRRRGYARQVVAAWAAQVLAQGKVAFYSHEIDNATSEALARSLGMMPYALSVSYS
jgi:GNAT superfamily N-acetyltransferase